MNKKPFKIRIFPAHNGRVVIFGICLMIIWFVCGAFLINLERNLVVYVSDVVVGICLSLLLFMLAALICSNDYCKEIPDKTIVLDADRKIITDIERGISYLSFWEQMIKESNFISYALRSEIIKAKINWLSDQTGSKDWLIEVQVEYYGTVEAYLACHRELGDKDIADFVTFWLYEFGVKKANAITRFYNPLDHNQQERFSKLVVAFLTPRLKKAQIRIKSASFNLPQ